MYCLVEATERFTKKLKYASPEQDSSKSLPSTATLRYCAKLMGASGALCSPSHSAWVFYAVLLAAKQ